MGRVGFILKPDKSEAGRLIDRLVPSLTAAGHEVVFVAEDQVGAPGARIVPEDEFPAAIDIAVVLGGDGTMLRASVLVADDGIPVLGINLGRLGFLTPFDPSVAEDVIEQALSGKLSTSNRMRLKVTFQPADGEAVTRTALNDAVIHQGSMARLIELEARLDDALIARYRADGLIIATPTGSTAYNLAAGGPIIVPDHAGMALTPICAHALTNRPLVIPPDGTIGVSLGGESHGVVLTVDGQWARTFSPGDRASITTDAQPLIAFNSSKNYFDILREKLHWDARSGK
jgi:NAD+ kinase